MERDSFHIAWNSLRRLSAPHIIHWQQQWQHTMIAATSSFDFQRESHFYLLLSVVCTAHGTNITQNECAFHLCPMWLLHITPPSAHNQKWNRDWDTNWANKCKLQTSNVDVLNRTHRILYIASNKLFTNSIKSDFFFFSFVCDCLICVDIPEHMACYFCFIICFSLILMSFTFDESKMTILC